MPQPLLVDGESGAESLAVVGAECAGDTVIAVDDHPVEADDTQPRWLTHVRKCRAPRSSRPAIWLSEQGLVLLCPQQVPTMCR